MLLNFLLFFANVTGGSPKIDEIVIISVDILRCHGFGGMSVLFVRA